MKTAARIRRFQAMTIAGLFAALVMVFGFADGALAQIPEGVTIADAFVPGAGEPVGAVVTVQGEAVVMHADEKVGYRIANGLALFEGDTVVTLKDAFASIQMNDGSQFSLSSDTRIVISQSIFDENRKERSALIGMGLGKVRFFIKNLAGFKRSEFKVKTRTAILGVRGSDFIVISTLDYTQVITLLKTALQVMGLVAPEAEPRVLKDYQKTMIRLGGVPADIERVSAEEAESFRQELPIIRNEDLLTRTLENSRAEMQSKGLTVSRDLLAAPPPVPGTDVGGGAGVSDAALQTQIAGQENEILNQEAENIEDARATQELISPEFPEPPMNDNMTDEPRNQ